MKALVSIVIPTYNRKQVISRAIDSCLSQTYRDIEIVVCDDHSSDGTMEYIRAKYGHIKDIIYCVTPAGKKGSNAARNEGIKRAKGQFIAFLDSDDYLLNDSIENRMKVYEGAKCGLVYGDVYLQELHRKTRRLCQWERIDAFEQKKYLMEELSLCNTSSIMVKKCIIEEIGYLDETLRSWQDDDLIVSVGMRYRICSCSKPVAVIITSSKNSITKNEENIYQGCKRIVRKHRREIILHSSSMRYLIWQVRILSLWAKYRQRKAKNPIKKAIFGIIYIITNRMITPFFRHMYA